MPWVVLDGRVDAQVAFHTSTDHRPQACNKIAAGMQLNPQTSHGHSHRQAPPPTAEAQNEDQRTAGTASRTRRGHSTSNTRRTDRARNLHSGASRASDVHEEGVRALNEALQLVGLGLLRLVGVQEIGVSAVRHFEEVKKRKS